MDLALGSASTGVQKSNFSQAHQRAPYNAFKSKVTWIHSNGIKQAIPATAQLTDAEFVATRSPSGAKIVEWTAERQGEEPAIPDFVTPKEGEALAWWKIATYSTDQNQDGSSASDVYRTEGVAVFYLKRPLGIDSGKITFGGSPINASQPKALSPGQIDSTLL